MTAGWIIYANIITSIFSIIIMPSFIHKSRGGRVADTVWGLRRRYKLVLYAWSGAGETLFKEIICPRKTEAFAFPFALRSAIKRFAFALFLLVSRLEAKGSGLRYDSLSPDPLVMGGLSLLLVRITAQLSDWFAPNKSRLNRWTEVKIHYAC